MADRYDDGSWGEEGDPQRAAADVPTAQLFSLNRGVAADPAYQTWLSAHGAGTRDLTDTEKGELTTFLKNKGYWSMPGIEVSDRGGIVPISHKTQAWLLLAAFAVAPTAAGIASLAGAGAVAGAPALEGGSTIAANLPAATAITVPLAEGAATTAAAATTGTALADIGEAAPAATGLGDAAPAAATVLEDGTVVGPAAASTPAVTAPSTISGLTTPGVGTPATTPAWTTAGSTISGAPAASTIAPAAAGTGTGLWNAFTKIAPVAGNLIGTAIAAKAQGDASAAQLKAAEEALAFEKDVYNTRQTQLAPAINVGNASSLRLADLMGLKPGSGGWNATPPQPGTLAPGATQAPPTFDPRNTTGAPAGYTAMLAPDGSRGFVPTPRVQEAINAGGKLL